MVNTRQSAKQPDATQRKSICTVEGHTVIMVKISD